MDLKDTLLHVLRAERNKELKQQGGQAAGEKAEAPASEFALQVVRLLHSGNMLDDAKANILEELVRAGHSGVLQAIDAAKATQDWDTLYEQLMGLINDAATVQAMEREEEEEELEEEFDSAHG